MRDTERVQQRATEMVSELQHLSCGRQRAGAIQPGGEKSSGESTNVHKELKVGCKKDGAMIFPEVSNTRVRDSWHKQEVPFDHQLTLCFSCEGD